MYLRSSFIEPRKGRNSLWQTFKIKNYNNIWLVAETPSKGYWLEEKVAFYCRGEDFEGDKRTQFKGFSFLLLNFSISYCF